MHDSNADWEAITKRLKETGIMTTFTTEDRTAAGTSTITYDTDTANAAGEVLKVLAGAVPEGFAPMVLNPVEGHVPMAEVKTSPKPRNPASPMSFGEIQELFGISLGDEGMHAELADLIETVRKIEKFHGIG